MSGSSESFAKRPARQPGLDELRLLTKVARLYHEKGIRQPQIAAELSLSQPRVSRLLKQAADIGIVRTVVTMPNGVHAEVEDKIQERYDLRDVVVVDTLAEDDVSVALGAAAASYLDATFTGHHVVGISSWSETLINAVDRMPRKSVAVVDRVVQLLGGLGDPLAQRQATHLTARFAEVTGAMTMYLPAPGLVGSAATRKTMLRDPAVKEVTATWGQLTDVLVGIGTLQPSPLLQRSGNAIADDEQEELRRLGAVGDVALRYFDGDGNRLTSHFDRRVMGISPEELLAVPRRVGIAGGSRKFAAIRGALRGQWINVLITDLALAQRLVKSRD